MTEVSVEVEFGRICAIDLASLVAGQAAIAGPARLMGWSLRESGFETNKEVEGSVVGPGAGGVIVTTGGMPGGTYVIKWSVQLIGAAAAADQNNFGLYSGATLLETSLNAGVAGVYPQPDVQDSNPFGSAYSVKAIGAGTAGVTYAAQITVTASVEYGSVMELRDGNSAIAEIAIPVAGSNTAWFGPDGVHIYNQIKTVTVAGLLTGCLYVRYWGTDY
jgi:hypothetical protein